MYSTRQLIILCLFSFSALVSSRSVSLFGYHERVGIPKALELISKEFDVSRIVGGSQVTSQSPIPHQAGIVVTLTSGWTSICGGALISNARVLTAAHCWWDGTSQARQFTIVLGSLTLFTGGTRVDTTDVIVHPNWNSQDITNDVALAKISHVSYTNNIQAVALPATSDAGQDFSGETAIASGYGKTSDAQSSFPTTTSLHQVSLAVITNTECQKSFDFPLHGSHLCTSGVAKVGTCEGDSGGPLTVVWNNIRTVCGLSSEPCCHKKFGNRSSLVMKRYCDYLVSSSCVTPDKMFRFEDSRHIEELKDDEDFQRDYNNYVKDLEKIERHLDLKHFMDRMFSTGPVEKISKSNK